MRACVINNNGSSNNLPCYPPELYLEFGIGSQFWHQFYINWELTDDTVYDGIV